MALKKERDVWFFQGWSHCSIFLQAAGEEEAEGSGTAEVAEAAEAEEPPPPRVKEQKLANQFNFIERASRTLNNPMRVYCHFFQ